MLRQQLIPTLVVWEGLGFYLLVALCVVVCLLSVGGNFEEEVTVRLLSLVARMQNYLDTLK